MSSFAEVFRSSPSIQASTDGALDKFAMPHSNFSLTSDEWPNALGGINFESDTPVLPSRQPIAPDPDLNHQQLVGFARWLRTSTSPRTHRVTAGGRIVPAEPNSPPPTFHQPFLEEFVAAASGNTGQQHGVRGFAVQNPAPQANHLDLSRKTIMLGNEFPIHPALKVPRGFQVLQTQCGGTVAILSSGTTCYLAQLTENGETNLQIMKPAGEIHNLDPFHQYACVGSSEQQDRRWQSAASGYRGLSSVLSLPPQERMETRLQNTQPNEVGVSGFSKQPVQVFSPPSEVALSLQDCNTRLTEQDIGTAKEQNHSPRTHELSQIVSHQPDAEEQAAAMDDLSSVNGMYERAKQALANLQTLISTESQYRPKSQLVSLFKREKEVISMIVNLSEQKRHLESLQPNLWGSTSGLPYQLSSNSNAFGPPVDLYQRGQVVSSEHTKLSNRAVFGPFEHKTASQSLSFSDGTNGNHIPSNRMLWATAPSFVPRSSINVANETGNQGSLQPYKVHDGDHNLSQRMISFSLMDGQSDIQTVMPPTYNTTNHAVDDVPIQKEKAAASNGSSADSSERSSAITEVDKTWPCFSEEPTIMDIEKKVIRASLSKRGEDKIFGVEKVPHSSAASACEEPKSSPLTEKDSEAKASDRSFRNDGSSAMPWTWGKLPGETDKQYEDRMLKRHSQACNSKPRRRLDDENSPFHAAIGVVTRESPNSAANSLAASIESRRQHSSVSMRGGNSNLASINSLPSFQHRLSEHYFPIQHLTVPRNRYSYDQFVPSPVILSANHNRPKAHIATNNAFATVRRYHDRTI